ncbi:MAG: ATPase, T2SS/T4P/T4SS family [Acidimicrobiia bacterium]
MTKVESSYESELDVYEQLRHSVITLIDKEKINPSQNPEVVENIIDDVIRSHNNFARINDNNADIDVKLTSDRLKNSIFGYGALTSILNNKNVEEIFIEGSRVSYIDSSGFLKGLEMPTTEVENRHVIDTLLSETDRTLTVKSPIVQARILQGQARLTASINPISDHLSATIRKYVVKNITLDQLADKGSLSKAASKFLWACMQTRSRIIISGEPGSGKTTLLSALLIATPINHCIRCCEEIREISVEISHGGFYEVRPNGVDGTGEITLRDLVKFTLAMRPDRIVCGEVRGAEAFELSRAVNAGCGFACTVHSNNAVDGLEALVNASLMAGENVTERTMRNIFSSAIDIVIHVDREETASHENGLLRGVTEIVAVEPSLNETFTTTPLFYRENLNEELKFIGSIPKDLEKRLNKVLINKSISDLVAES